LEGLGVLAEVRHAGNRDLAIRRRRMWRGRWFRSHTIDHAQAADTHAGGRLLLVQSDSRRHSGADYRFCLAAEPRRLQRLDRTVVRNSEVVSAINAVVQGVNITLPEGRNPDRPQDNYLDTTGCGWTPASGRTTTSNAPYQTPSTG
jgi:hypothetical protein